jgi:hypothetical protein
LALGELFLLPVSGDFRKKIYDVTVVLFRQRELMMMIGEEPMKECFQTKAILFLS